MSFACLTFRQFKSAINLSWSSTIGRGTPTFSNLSFARRATAKASYSQSVKFGLK